MRTSRYFLATLKEAPADAELISHKLMLRAGLIRRLAGGIYTWMPMGLRVVRKVESIIREEMNRAGALELFMPAVQPAELWQESGRWEKYGPELLRFKDRHERDFVIGPTHEEVITDIARREIRSYRQLPVHFYQIQTKFRDEIRPRFGVMRGREFTMKDGYSFHASFADLQREYRNMHETYQRIFERLGLRFRAVAADPGSIGAWGRDGGLRGLGLRRQRRARRGRGTGGAAQGARRCDAQGAHARQDALRGRGGAARRAAHGDGEGHRGHERGPPHAAARARRPYAERDQGAEGDRRVPLRRRRRDRAGARVQAGLHRPGGREGEDRRRPLRRGDERLRVRRERGRIPPHGRELRARSRRAGRRRRHPQRRRRRP